MTNKSINIRICNKDTILYTNNFISFAITLELNLLENVKNSSVFLQILIRKASKLIHSEVTLLPVGLKMILNRSMFFWKISKDCLPRLK